MAELPSGTVTFLFTDLEGSTRLWEQQPDAMQAALARHDEILRDAVERTRRPRREDDRRRRARGVRDRRRRRVVAAVDAQQSLAAEPWPDDRAAARAHGRAHRRGRGARRRLLRHRGESRGAARWRSPTAVRCVVSQRDRGARCATTCRRAWRCVDLGEHRLRDLARAERVFQLARRVSRDEFPPLRSLDAFPGNLPVQLTSFVGRERELAVDRRALGRHRARDAHRRRRRRQDAPRAAGRRRDASRDFADGAWFCELARGRRRRVDGAARGGHARRAPAAGDDARGRASSTSSRPKRAAARARQLRAPARRRPRGSSSACCVELPGRARPRDEPRGARRRRRAGRRAAVAVVPRPSTTSTTVASDAVRLFVERAAAARAGFALDAGNVERGRRDLPAARRHPARDRARGGARRVDEPRRDRQPASTSASGCSPAGGAPRSSATRRCARDGRLVVLAARRPASERCSTGSGCSRAAFDAAAATAVAERRRRSPTGTCVDALDGLVAQVDGGRRSATTRATPATRCSRRCGSTRASGSASAGEVDGWRRRHAEHYAAWAAAVGPELRTRDELVARGQILSDVDNLPHRARVGRVRRAIPTTRASA